MTIDLQPFCGTFCNDDFDKPFGFGEYTYATNGHIVVRVPLIAGTERKPPVKVAGIKFYPENEHLGSWIKVPQYDAPEKERCGSCKGSKRAAPCHDCDGDGTVEMLHRSHWYEAQCKECDGEGLIPGGDKTCSSCDGSGETYTDQYARQKIENVTLAVRLLDKIKALPGAELYFPAQKSGMVNFRFDGGVGLVMKMKE